MKPASLRPFLPLPALRRPRPHPRSPRRNYALQTPGAPLLQVFNSATKYLQRERAAADHVASRNVDYLRDELAARLCDRLLVPLFLSSPALGKLSLVRSLAKVSIAAIGYQSPFLRRPGSWR